MTTRLRLPLAAALTVLLLVAAACGSGRHDAGASSSDGASSSGSTINIVGFAVPEAANKAIAAEFTTTDAGKGVKFETSYGASGDQSRAVVAGLEADYVHLSVTSDVTRLVDAGLVADDWDDGPNEGVVSSSIVVFAVREGNPKDIRTWDDLVEPGWGSGWRSSGSACWC